MSTKAECEKHPTLFLCYADHLHRREKTGCSQLEPGRGIKARDESFALGKGKRYINSMDKVVVEEFWSVESCKPTHN